MREALENIRLFQDLTAAQLDAIGGYCQLQQLTDGTLLIEEGRGGARDLYILIKGAVEIVSRSGQSTSGEVVISKEEVDVLGEVAWLTGEAHIASVRCHGDVVLIRVDGDALSRFVEKDTDAGFKVMRQVALTLARRMESADDLLKQILWNTSL